MKPNTIVIAPLIGTTLAISIGSLASGTTSNTRTEMIDGVQTTVTDINERKLNNFYESMSR
ncbi:hypothetical protein CONCODRAFT_10002 [Conidiobolus coronatus NRRL 28638]|uniref:Uncharacterized protein n=1 Tax=Conidiobolus coronatus (strain ATCC 28846 / CBS 209.66 / NRRL 28638) TaxID=796925 RepID=A0A137NYV4_CONC2|nr:hypothetical protein CONCODRAFT_10002 [Conidiobolus coronatus NRRL 28638]|eukprot:KXN67868.1 hypothetical protein CONCODRAFT_10002 [Conidiobolus coronatus NRRL 28638]